MKPILRELWSFIKVLHVEAWRLFRRRWPLFLLGLIGVLGTVVLIVPHDKAWLADIQQPEHVVGSEPLAFTPIHYTARQLSSWGDFFKLNIILLVVGLPLAIALKSMKWRRIVLIVFFAALWSGIAVNILRPGFGRARPSTNVEDGLNPMTFQHGYHSFPSGHTTTTFATATAISIMCPPAAVPAYLVAGGVSWSRMQLDRHHPADIVGGMGLGIFWGIVFGGAGRRLIRLTETRGKEKEKAVS